MTAIEPSRAYVAGRDGELVADRRQQPVVRLHLLLARVHQHEAAGAVRALGVALAEARLAEQRRALVAERRGHRDAAERGGLPVDLRGGADLRQHRPRHAERVQQRLVPVERLEAHQHRPAGVRRVGQVAAGEVPDQPRVDRPEQDLARLGALAQPADRVQQPAELRGREVRRQRQPALQLEAILALVARELTDQAIGAHVLPVDRVVHRLAGRAIPHHGGLALVGDAEGHEVGGLELRPLQRALDHFEHVRPDLERIVLHPAGAGKDVVVFLLADRDHARLVVEDQAARGSRALIDRRDVLSFHHGMAPRSRETARAASLTYETSSVCGSASLQSRSTGPEIPIAPTASPRRSLITAA